jgi:hypothetical protein
MRILASAAVVLALLSTVGCDGSTPLQPDQRDLAPTLAHSPNAAARGRPETEPTYANGTTVYMIGPRLSLAPR